MKYISLYLSAFCFVLAGFLSGCDTDIESIEINQPGVEEQDAALYSKYLENLRTYKASNHKVVFAWFDNKDDFYTQADHLMALPDSVDYAVLMTPYNIFDGIYEEMKEAKAKKGIKTVYSIEYSAIKTIYEERAEALNLAQLNGERLDETMPEFTTFITDSVKQATAYCDQYGYDGIIFAFDGVGKENMSDSDKQLYAGYEDAFVSPAMEWQINHPTKEMIFQGKPSTIYNYIILDNAKYVIIPCRDLASAGAVAYTMAQQQAVTTVDTDKFIPLVETVSLDNNDTATGWFLNGTRSVIGTAQWVASPYNEVPVAGMGVYNVNREYYNSVQTYRYVREAISLINPTAKN